MDLKTKKKNRVKLLVVCQISIAGLVRLVTVPCFLVQQYRAPILTDGHLGFKLTFQVTSQAWG